jgi:catechol 2,3-dioxygenase-like lactoylglutathione lyase family enzyme
MSVFVSAVLLKSKDPRRLYDFYKTIIGLPLEEEQHGDSELHFGCEIGDLHFAIHGVKEDIGVGSVRVAFEVFDIEAFLGKLKDQGLAAQYPPRDLGFMKLTAVADPDGNIVEITQLSDRWYKHLEQNRAMGSDMLQTWKTRAQATGPH